MKWSELSKRLPYSVPIALLLILLAIGIRFLPHPANFTPLAAVALFSGVYLPRRYVLIVPVAAMIVSDFFIGFHNLVLFTWGSFALVGLMGWWIKKHKSIWSVTGGAVTASLLFFLITNWAVMQFTPLYPASVTGLVASYTAGIPFFRNMLLGDLMYTGVLFGLYEAVAYYKVSRTIRAGSRI